MSKASVTIDGLEHLERAFRGLTDKMAKKVLVDAVKDGTNVVYSAAKANAATISPNIAKAVSRKKLRSLHKFETAYKVHYRPRTLLAVDRPIDQSTEWGQALAHGGYSLIANFFEYGTSKMSARPFLAPAYENTKAQAQRVIGESLGKGIEQAAREEGVRL